MACVYKEQGRFDEADRLFGEAFNIASKKLMDQDCPEALAAAAEQMDIEKAVRHAEYLCDGSYRNFCGPDSIAKAERTYLLGRVYNANKQYDYAERVLRATLVWYERVHGVNHNNTGECVTVLGAALLSQDKFDDETRAVIQRSLYIHLLNLGPDAKNVGIANHSLGVFHEKRGDFVLAKPFYKEALRIYTKVQGPDHPETVGVKNDLLHVSAI